MARYIKKTGDRVINDCPGENIIRHGLVWLCQDSRKDGCQCINIISNREHVEIYICQDPHPVEEKQ